jgi:hypothetical protein
MGVGGSNLTAVKRKCIFIMKVTEKIDFNQYWCDERFSLKRAVRNGSRLQVLGDNIYHFDSEGGWIQENSHHSNHDGSMNVENLLRDTGRCDKVLVSEYYCYFGSDARAIDLESIGYFKIRNFKKTILQNSKQARDLISSLENSNRSNWNQIVEDPCQFMDSHQRVDQVSGRLID